MHPKVFFDHHDTSMAFFVFEFSRIIIKQLHHLITQLNTNSKEILGMLKIHSRRHYDSIVDLAPYSSNQIFRLPLCGKLGKSPLRIVSYRQVYGKYKYVNVFESIQYYLRMLLLYS